MIHVRKDYGLKDNPNFLKRGYNLHISLLVFPLLLKERQVYLKKSNSCSFGIKFAFDVCLQSFDTQWLNSQD